MPVRKSTMKKKKKDLDSENNSGLGVLSVYANKDVKKYLKVGDYQPAEDSTDEIIERECYGQGYIFKDEEAYETSLNKVCYIAELSDSLYTHQNFLDMCDGQEKIARDFFDRVDWQHPESLLQDDYVSGEYTDCEKCKRMFAAYDAVKCPHCAEAYDNQN